MRDEYVRHERVVACRRHVVQVKRTLALVDSSACQWCRREVKRIWHRVEHWLRAHAPEALAELREGVSQGDLERLQLAIGAPLPPDFMDFYRVHDGAVGQALFGGWELLSVEQALLTRGMMNDLGWGTPELPNEGQPHGPVKPLWWSAWWIPILTDASGDMFCVDLQPARGGHVGQLISFVHDSPDRKVVTASLRSWFDEFASDLEAGRYYRDDERFGWIVRVPEPARSQSATASEGRRLLSALLEIDAIELEDARDPASLIKALDSFLAKPGRTRTVHDLTTLLLNHPDVAEVYIDDDRLSLLLEQW